MATRNSMPAWMRWQECSEEGRGERGGERGEGRGESESGAERGGVPKSRTTI